MIAELYRCIVYEHDYRFLILAVFLCLFSSFTAVSLQQRARLSEGQQQRNWIIFSAITIGAGIWATHFVAMIAYDAGMPVSYSILSTLGSIVVAIVISGIGFAYAALRRGKTVRATAGAIVGVGISSMHFLGMAGMQVRGTFHHETEFVVVGVLAGIFFGSLAVLSMHKTHDIIRYFVSSTLLTLAICSLHFTAMAGLVVTYDPSVEMVQARVSQELLGGGAALIAAGLLSSSFFSSFKGQNEAFKQAQEKQSFRRLADASLEGIVVMDNEGLVLNANHSFCEMIGKKLPAIRKHDIWSFFSGVASNQSIPSLAAENVKMEEARLLAKDDKAIPVELFFRVVETDSGVSYVTVVRDISDQRLAESKINYLTNYDALTGLVNRHLFMDRLHHAAQVSASKGEDIAIFYIDIDSFKEINSLYGNVVGDAILAKVSKRLSAAVPATSTLARFGADQFCLLSENIKDSSDTVSIAENLTDAFLVPLVTEQGEIPISISVGVAVEPVDENDPDSLLSQAEIALKRAKKHVGNSYRFYEDQFDQTIVRRRRLKRDLQAAITQDEISLVYQPQFECLDGRVTGFEALVRWMHPELGFISPEEFIALAEESNQINTLGAWILDAACKEASSWHKELTIAVNLSPVQFQQGTLVETVQETLSRYNLDPQRLELEITEGVLISDAEKALALLNQLKDMGIKLAMDDFGTGYSSLSYLQTFPFDKLKIDKSFVQVMLESDHKLNIVRGMIGLARGLKMPVLAEGVETEGQYAILRAEGCSEVQGYYLGKPQAISDYAGLVRNRLVPAET